MALVYCLELAPGQPVASRAATFLEHILFKVGANGGPAGAAHRVLSTVFCCYPGALGCSELLVQLLLVLHDFCFMNWALEGSFHTPKFHFSDPVVTC